MEVLRDSIVGALWSGWRWVYVLGFLDISRKDIFGDGEGTLGVWGLVLGIDL